MLPSFCNDTVTIWRAPLKDSRGTQVRDWTNAESHEVAGCSFQPTGTKTDFEDTRQNVTIRATLYLPPEADIEADDRVEFRGTRYGMNGGVLPWTSPTGAVSHLVCQLVDWRQ